VEAAIDDSTIAKLRTSLRGAAYKPGDEGYDEGRRAFNLNAHQEPALVVVAESAEDIVGRCVWPKSKVSGSGYWPRVTASPPRVMGAS
jgi:hypothetical protein